MNQLLRLQLMELGLSDETQPSDLESWRRLLQKISRAYDEDELKQVRQDQMIKLVKSEYNDLVSELQKFNDDLESRVREKTEQLLDRQNSIQSQKMQALGEMAAGIAHEINNPLAVVTAKTEQLKRMLVDGRLPDADKLRDFIVKIEKNTQRIVQIITGLRSFARDESHGTSSKVTIQSIVDDTLTMCRDRLMNGKTRFELEQPLDPILVYARPSQISQILLNLLNNALDACEKMPDPQITLSIVVIDGQVEARVWDNGPGVSPAIEDRIMQPFFTTKPSGKGTGLGLSISLGIAREHGGFLELDRSVAPSCFVLSLPVYEASQEAPRENSPRAA